MISNIIKVFVVNDKEFYAAGEVDDAKSIIATKEYQKFGSIEITVPITQRNVELLVKGNIIWLGDTSAYFIEYIQYDTTENEGLKQMIFKVKGKDLKSILMQRIVWTPYSKTNKHISELMYGLVYSNIYMPSNSLRKYPYFYYNEDKKQGAKVESYQKTGGQVYEAIESLAIQGDLGFDVQFDAINQRFKFIVLQGIDRSNPDNNDNFVCLSTDLEGILGSLYTTDISELKTVALIAGEGKGALRQKEVVGAYQNGGMLRQELYIDARDLQKTYTDETGIEHTLTDEEYTGALKQRGAEKLSDCKVIDSFEADIKTFGTNQYEYEKDYNLGDTILMKDTDLGVQVSAMITASQESWENSEYKLSLTIGYGSPTLFDKINKYLN